jgi:DNA repair protein RadC
MRLKDLPLVDQPRAKLERYGPNKLTNAELLAVILGTGKRGMNVLELSRKIFTRFPNTTLAEASLHDLQRLTGLGPSKASEIIACFELGRRLLKNKKSELLLTPHHVWDAMSDIRNLKKEHFVVFYLDAHSQNVERTIVSIGTVNASIAHPREVFEGAIKQAAVHIVLAHNHPSGNPQPSPEDITLTERLYHAGNLLGIPLLDHIIVTEQSCLSLQQQGFFEAWTLT